MENLRGLLGVQGVRLAALCDCDQSVLDKGKTYFEGKGQKDIQTYQDIRKLLEDKNVDAVIDRHAEPLALAGRHLGGAGGQGCLRREAGLATTSAKAASSSKRARKYDKIFQTGTQSRSSHRLHRGGRMGPAKAISARSMWRAALCYKRRTSIGKVTGERADPGRHRLRSLVRPRAEGSRSTANSFHYDWHWVWDYGNGDLGNQGIHQMDIARWVLGEDALSPGSSASAAGLATRTTEKRRTRNSSFTTTQRPRSISKCAAYPPAPARRRWTHTAARASVS